MTKHDFHLGKLKINAPAYGSQGNAVLGIRDSGKTYTATELAEKLFEAGIPFTTFDPTGVWRFLRVPGAGRGYPIVVAGGLEGDLPLTVNGAPEIVRAAMKNGVSIVLDLTDQHLSKADWKRIVKSCVRVMLSENAQHGLRHVFIEEAAEFIPQKVLDGDVYAEVEKLCRIGGNSRLGYTLINQRSQEVNKACLELCENLFLHRQKGKNALESLDKWFDVAEVAERGEIMKSLPNLTSGKCWAWMGGADEIPLLIQVPAKNSYHPDRRAMRGDVAVLSKMAVDVGSFVSSMKGSLVEIETEAKANDPKLLRAEIARLEAALKVSGGAQPAADPIAIALAEQHGYSQGFEEAKRQGMIAFNTLKANARATISGFASSIDANLAGEYVEWIVKNDAPVAPARPAARAPAATHVASPMKPRQSDSGLPGPQQRILDSLATWRDLGHATPSNAQVSWLARYSPTSSSYTNPRSALNIAELIQYPDRDCLALTPAGAAAATPIQLPGRILDFVLSNLPGPDERILRSVANHYPKAASNEVAAAGANYSASSSSYTNPRSALRTKGLVTYPGKDQIRAADWLFAA